MNGLKGVLKMESQIVTNVYTLQQIHEKCDTIESLVIGCIVICFLIFAAVYFNFLKSIIGE